MTTQTGRPLACFGVCCPHRADCARYAQVDTAAEGASQIDSCEVQTGHVRAWPLRVARAGWQPAYLPCRLCGAAAYMPPVVHGGSHDHHQVACNECGIEVCRLSAAESLAVWNRLMGLAPR